MDHSDFCLINIDMWDEARGTIMIGDILGNVGWNRARFDSNCCDLKLMGGGFVDQWSQAWSSGLRSGLPFLLLFSLFHIPTSVLL
jgi:hypothetical protein